MERDSSKYKKKPTNKPPPPNNLTGELKTS